MLTGDIVLCCVSAIVVVVAIVLSVREIIKTVNGDTPYKIFMCDRMIEGGGCSRSCEGCPWRRNYYY